MGLGLLSVPWPFRFSDGGLVFAGLMNFISPYKFATPFYLSKFTVLS